MDNCQPGGLGPDFPLTAQWLGQPSVGFWENQLAPDLETAFLSFASSHLAATSLPTKCQEGQVRAGDKEIDMCVAV